jgi:hypothetical protein
MKLLNPEPDIIMLLRHPIIKQEEGDCGGILWK